jgi:hypothetical protein
MGDIVPAARRLTRRFRLARRPSSRWLIASLACLVGVAVITAACWIVPKHESVKLTFDNRTDSLLCYHLSQESASFGGCDQKIQPMVSTTSEPGCGYGAGAEKLPLTVILRVGDQGRRIYDRTEECRVWQASGRTFVIEQRGDEFVVTDPLTDATPSP